MNRHGFLKGLAGGLAGAALIVLSAGAWHAAQAQPWGGHRGGIMGLGGLVHGMDLTPDQKKKLAGILRTHKAEFLQARDKMTLAGRAVMEGIADQAARADALQAKLDAAADAGKQLGKVWITVRQEALAILTAEQRQDLAKRQKRFLERMEKRISDHARDREQDIDEWIERLSK